MLSSFRPLVQVFLLFLLTVVAAVEEDKEQEAFTATEGKQEGDQVEACGNQLTSFLLCLSSTGGAIFNDAFQEECQGCIAAEYGTNAVDISMLSCDELVQVVGGALDRCVRLSPARTVAATRRRRPRPRQRPPAIRWLMIVLVVPLRPSWP
jgi:hypothetical protein